MHVIIIPGWKQTTEDWSAVVQEITRIGHTAVVVEYTMPKRDDLEDIMEAANFHINQKCVVVGHSIGGRAAVLMGTQPLHHVVGIMLMSTPSLSVTGMWQRIYKLYRFFSAPVRIIIPGFIARRVAAVWDKVRAPSPDKKQYRVLTESDQDSLMPVQKLPVKLLWGSNDKVVKPRVGEAMAEMMPECDYVEVAGGSDTLYKDEPELVANAIIDFAIANS